MTGAPGSPPRLSDGVWASVLQWSRLGVNALVFLVVARFLTLPEIGAFAMAAAPLRFFQVIHKSGIEDGVVIHPAPPDDSAILSLFAVSMGLAGVIVTLSWVFAVAVDLIAPNADHIGRMTIVLSLGSLCHGLAAVPDGLLRRAGQFRRLALRTLVSQAIAAGAAGAALLAGAGVWALVIFTLVNAALATAISVLMAGWRPARALPDMAHLRRAMAQTMAISGRVLMGAAIQPVLQIAIGSFGGLAAAGVFQIATRVLALLDAVTLAPLRFLALPRFSRLTGRPDDLRKAVLAALSVAGLSSAYVYLGTMVAAPGLLSLLVGGQSGAATVTTVQLMCLGGLGGAGAAVVNQVLLGIGAAGMAFRLSVVQAIMSLGLALPFAGQSPALVAAALTLTSVVMLALFLGQLGRLTGIAPGPALGAVGRPYLAGAIMVGGVALLGWAMPDAMQPMPRLGVQIVVGTVLYLLAVRVVAPQAVAVFRRVAGP